MTTFRIQIFNLACIKMIPVCIIGLLYIIGYSLVLINRSAFINRLIIFILVILKVRIKLSSISGFFKKTVSVI